MQTLLVDELVGAGIALHQIEELDTSLGKPLYVAPLRACLTTSVWNSLRNLTEKTGYWPLLVTDRDAITKLIEPMGKVDLVGFSQIVEGGEALDFEGWLAHAEARDKEHFDFRSELMGEWLEDCETSHIFAQLFEFRMDSSSNMTFEERHTVFLLLCPVYKPWHIAALLNFGGGNSCPDPLVHTAAFKYWNERYGAEPAFIALNTVEFYLADPPRTREQATDLATQHYLYCREIVVQGAESISALASYLLDSTVWIFWWD